MPSNSILEQKKAIVASLSEDLKKSTAGVVVNYQGITVEDDTVLRKTLREAGVKYTVMKNSLTGRACDDAGLGDMKPYLKGMTAIAISENDPVAPAKILKKYEDKIASFEIVAGYLDGAVIEKATVMKLADIPPKEVLIAKLLGSIKSPLYGFAYALQGIIDKSGETAEPTEAAEAVTEAAADVAAE